MQVSATDAKNRFGYYLGQAEREPVQVMKNARVAVVMVSAARYAELEALEQQKSLGQRKREFDATYAEWIGVQHGLIERVGVLAKTIVPGERPMAQFDVYANPSKTQRGEIPWMVDIQSDILDKLPTRLVIPLAARTHMPAAMPRSLCPSIGWNGTTLVALPHLAAPFRVKDLGPVYGNLRPQASEFVTALDAVMSGI